MTLDSDKIQIVQTALLFVITVVFLGTTSHIFAGENRWTKLKARVSNDSLQLLVVDPLQPEVLYGFAKPQGFLRTQDGGATWETMKQALPRREIQKIVIDPFRRRRIYACTDSGLYLSRNAGEEWNCIGFPDTTVNAVAVMKGNSDTLYAAIGNEFYQTQNGGAKWLPALLNVQIKTTIRAIAISPNNPNRLYIGTDGGIYKFERERGVFKQRKGPEFSEQKTIDLIVDPLNTKVVFALFVGPEANAGVRWAEDDFWYWGKMNFGLDAVADLPLRSLSFNPTRPRTLYACNYHNDVFSFDFAFPEIAVLDFSPLALPPWEVADFSQRLADRLRKTHSVKWLSKQESKALDNEEVLPESKETAVKFSKLFGFEAVVSGKIYFVKSDTTDQIRIVPRVTLVAQDTQFVNKEDSAFTIPRHDYKPEHLKALVSWVYEKINYHPPAVLDSTVTIRAPKKSSNRIWLGALAVLGLGYALHAVVDAEMNERKLPLPPPFPQRR